MKNILVTGVSRGLGLSITKIILEKDNYTVYGISRSKTKELDKLLIDYPNRFKWIFFDLENINDIRNNIFKEFIQFKTPIHGFVNNAAFSYDDILTNMNYEPLLKMYNVNVFAPFMITKYVIRHFLLHKIKGSIVHISSISAHTGYKGLAMYASSKGALEAFSKNTSREWGELGIRSNALVAGFMETEMSSTLSEDQKSRIFKRNSMKISTTTKSVSGTVLFLLSDASESITGQNIHVDSGTI